MEIMTLGNDGGLVRYQLRMSSWLSLLTHTAQSRVWQERPIEYIINSVLQTLPVRSYCIQYRETAFAFINRLLAEDGLSWRIEHDQPDATDGHSLVIFTDSRETTACEINPD